MIELTTQTTEALDEGTYTAKLKAVRAGMVGVYMQPDQPMFLALKFLFDVDGVTVQSGAIKVPSSLNSKANLSKYVAALAGKSSLGDNDRVQIDIDDEDNIGELYGPDNNEAFIGFNGKDLVGSEAMITVTVNEKGYNKIINIAPAPKKR